jgi:predicted Zn-dependent protease
MLDDAQLETIADALSQIREAEQALDDLIANTPDPDSLANLNLVYEHLTSCATTLIQSQTTSDDDLFTHLTTSLQGQANALQADENLIKRIISDAADAGKVLGYIAEAISLIARV